MLAKNFAVLGTTGSGKSCAVALILSAVLGEHPQAHIVVLDPHNEYSKAFGELAETVNVDNLRLPLWLLDFEEAVGVLVRGGTVQEQEAQAIILKDAMLRARRRYAGETLAASSITVDTPMPFGVSDLIRFIDEAMGRLDNPDTSAPYLRIRTRLESLRDDRRYDFMFSERLFARDTLVQIVGRLLRIPVDGKPITIIDLSGIPSEIADVVVSMIGRLTFDFSLWSERERMPPVLLVCEEAHRYVPAAENVGFGATARAMTRIAREGRKYGVALALITQLPSELSPQVLSQCGTIFALRLGHYLDQRFMATALPDAARGMLTALPSMRTQEAIAFGEGVRLPMHIRFADLPSDRQPRTGQQRGGHVFRPRRGLRTATLRADVRGPGRGAVPPGHAGAAGHARARRGLDPQRVLRGGPPPGDPAHQPGGPRRHRVRDVQGGARAPLHRAGRGPLPDGVPHADLGASYFDNRSPQTKLNRLVRQLKKLGFEATLQPIGEAA